MDIFKKRIVEIILVLIVCSSVGGCNTNIGENTDNKALGIVQSTQVIQPSETNHSLLIPGVFSSNSVSITNIILYQNGKMISINYSVQKNSNKAVNFTCNFNLFNEVGEKIGSASGFGMMSANTSSSSSVATGRIDSESNDIIVDEVRVSVSAF